MFRLRYDQIANFAGNLSTCLTAGVEIRKAIRTSAGALIKSHPEFGRVLDAVDRGESLSDALRTVQRRLPPFVIPVVRCGEQTGHLDQCLHFLAEHCRMLHRPSEALRNVWLLPLSIYFGGKVLRLLLMLLFGTWYGMTAAVGDLVASTGSLAAVVVVLLFTPIKALVDRVKLFLPVIGSVERELAVNRFLHVFSLLYGTGGQRVEQMVQQACQTVENDALREDLLRVAKFVKQGATLTEAFAQTTALTPDEQSELAAGDLAGRLSETAARMAQRAGESAATKLVWITTVTARITFGLVAFSLVGTILQLVLLSQLGR
jgi:type II secretory pathway component PulF